jgi:hypothetical protein
LPEPMIRTPQTTARAELQGAHRFGASRLRRLAGAQAPPPSNPASIRTMAFSRTSNWGPTIEIAAPGCYILDLLERRICVDQRDVDGVTHAAGALAPLPRMASRERGLASRVCTRRSRQTATSTGLMSGDGVQEPPSTYMTQRCSLRRWSTRR